MRILFLCHAFNSLTQRLFVVLREEGHEVSVEFDINDALSVEAVEVYVPDLIIAPFLKRAIPERIWRYHTCFIIHPGIPGDRGPSALDWAILNREKTWGVTVLQANEEMDGGDIWASMEFPMRFATKASLYRNEVTQAAVEAMLLAIQRFQSRQYKPLPLDYSAPAIRGQARPPMPQADRAIDWQQDSTEVILRKIHSADGFPGVQDKILGKELFLYDAWEERRLQGRAGELLARCGPAVCRATRDGAIWIGHLRDKNDQHPFKLPATWLLGEQISDLPETQANTQEAYPEIWYEEEDQVGYLYFNFYNGAMSTTQCERLRDAYRKAVQRDTRVIVLMGGNDFWSNGMHLNIIEAAQSAADESWRNINAIDDIALDIITTESKLTIAALRGNAGAGGVFLARAADEVWTHEAVILNPHYKDMGNLYGSEYWTYLLPRHAGKENAQRITQARLPMGIREGLDLGLIDAVLTKTKSTFIGNVKQRARELASDPAFENRLAHKSRIRKADEQRRSLQSYRDQELERMRMNFYGFDPSYHVARYNFVYKVPKSRTPLTIALHRRTGEKHRSVP